MRIAFIIGSTDIGGGTYVIFQHALYAKQLGHDVELIHILPQSHKNKWHPALDALTFVTPEEASGRHYDIAIATWWPTVGYLPKISATEYVYFVQSIESWFVPDQEVGVRRQIDATYLTPVPIITEARWIQEYLKKQLSHNAYLAPNGIAKDFLSSDGPCMAPPPKKGIRVLVEGPVGVDFKNVPRTIELVKKAKPSEIWLLTSSRISWYPGVDKVFSCIPADKVGEVYRSCDVLVKLSYVEGMFGPPLEMFHCGGTAVVYDVTGHDEYMNDLNSVIIPTGDEVAVVDAIKRLQNSPELLRKLKQGAQETARNWPDWDTASEKFFIAVENILAEAPAITGIEIEAMLAFGLPEDGDSAPRAGLKEKLWRAAKMIMPSQMGYGLLPLYYWVRYAHDRQCGRRTRTFSFKPEELPLNQR